VFRSTGKGTDELIGKSKKQPQRRSFEILGHVKDRKSSRLNENQDKQPDQES
jgi:hypothetical protein